MNAHQLIQILNHYNSQRVNVTYDLCFVAKCRQQIPYQRDSDRNWRRPTISDVSIVMKIQVEVFWVVTPCSAVVGYQRFRSPCCIHL
jgi:hypothetical protein